MKTNQLAELKIDPNIFKSSQSLSGTKQWNLNLFIVMLTQLTVFDTNACPIARGK